MGTEADATPEDPLSGEAEPVETVETGRPVGKGEEIGSILDTPEDSELPAEGTLDSECETGC